MDEKGRRTSVSRNVSLLELMSISFLGLRRETSRRETMVLATGRSGAEGGVCFLAAGGSGGEEGVCLLHPRKGACFETG